MKRIEDVNNFIRELTLNVVKSTNRDMIMNKLESERFSINRTVNTPTVQKRVKELEDKILKLGTTEIDYFVCLDKDKDYYYHKCIEAIELMGELTSQSGNWKSYDLRKDLLWTYVGILVKDDEMINWHHRDNHKKNSK